MFQTPKAAQSKMLLYFTTLLQFLYFLMLASNLSLKGNPV